MKFRGEELRFSSPSLAVTHVRGLATPVETQTTALADAHGLVLAQDVTSDRPSPPFDQSSMDGFAVRYQDARAGELRIVGEVRIGRPPPVEVAPGTAVRIVTGGAIPSGADTVLPHEDVCERDGSIRILESPKDRIRLGAYIRKRAENIEAGHLLIPRGTLLTPACIGVLASAGVTRPAVHRRLRIAIISTGDELVDAAQLPSIYQLRDGNAPALRAMLTSRPWIGHVDTVRVADSPTIIRAVIERAFNGNPDHPFDSVILSGGVSMGHRDHVRAVLEELGVQVVFHGLPQRPGKPMLAGIAPREQIVFALPGNPLSSIICCRRVVIPVLQSVAGIIDDAPHAAPCVRLNNPDGQSIPLWWHRLVRLTPDGEAMLVKTISSGDAAASARADGFIEVPPEHSSHGPFPFYSF